jgi:hypothetical protein
VSQDEQRQPDIPGGSGTGDGSAASKTGVSAHLQSTTAEPTTEVFGLGDPTLLDQALGERRALVEVCLYALDRARSSGVAQRIEQSLAGVGVAALRPDGEPFDPAQHEAGGTVVTVDPTLDGLVAETEVVGFTDHGRVLRAPVVIVYQLRPAR